ncbi:hypothetical protein [Lentilitoribacter sp. EG35]|uniref:hypothetical protein n=1 Tax=Lentilitoribacter sp. EG35 TaxID=3234192 RepID=UPI00345F8C3D
MKNVTKIILSIVTALFLLTASNALARSPSPSKGPADLYFLAVGGSSYIDPDFPSFNAPKKSATLVAKLLRENGARYGILLTDSKNDKTRISRKDVYQALYDLKQKIRRDGSKKARVIIYIVSHGLADKVSNYIYMMPGNLNVDPQPIVQNDVFRLAKRSIFNFDILTSMMSFRRDPRFQHLDDDLTSDRMSDANGFQRLIEQTQLEAQYSDYLNQKAASYGAAPFDNAPIPFVLLLDNCNDGFRYELVQSNPVMQLMVNAQYSATLDAGRAYYAAKPGEMANTMFIPSDLLKEEYEDKNGLSPSVGPLAIHLARVLHNKNPNEAMSLRSFDAEMLSRNIDNSNEYPDPVFAVSTPLREDVADVDFIPTKRQRMKIWQTAPATGTQKVECCKLR